MTETISVVLHDSPEKDDIKEIRCYSELSLVKIYAAIKVGYPVYKKNISKNEFYSGIFEISDFLSYLDDKKIRYSIYSDDKKIEKEYIQNIIKKVSNIKLEDFR